MQTMTNILLGLARVGLELSWLYAWANFITTAILNRSFPLPQAVGAYLVAAMATRTWWFPGKFRRVVFFLVFQMVGFGLAGAGILYHFSDGRYPFFGTAWLPLFFNQSRTAMDWIYLMLIGMLIVIFWTGGVCFARRSVHYTSACHRFDLGITAFFALFIVKLLLAVKGDIHIADPSSEILIFPFFLFSLFALGLINQRSGAPSAFLTGFQGSGLILSFATLTIGLGAAAVLMFLPFLTMAAETGYSALKVVASPLGPIIISILRFIFAPGRMRDDPISQSSRQNGIQLGQIPEMGKWSSFLQTLLIWVLVVVIGLMVVIAAGYLLRLLVRWLWSKISQQPESIHQPLPWRRILRQLREAIGRLGRFMGRMFRGYSSAAELFGALMRWGRHCGMARRPAETPLEYGLLLSSSFPELQREIHLIVEAYHQEIYRGHLLGHLQLHAARQAWRQVRSPRYWLVRLKVGFFQQPDRPEVFDQPPPLQSQCRASGGGL